MNFFCMNYDSCMRWIIQRYVICNSNWRALIITYPLPEYDKGPTLIHPYDSSVYLRREGISNERNIENDIPENEK